MERSTNCSCLSHVTCLTQEDGVSSSVHVHGFRVSVSEAKSKIPVNARVLALNSNQYVLQFLMALNSNNYLASVELCFLNRCSQIQVQEKREERIAGTVVTVLKLIFLLNTLNSFHGVWCLLWCKQKEDRSKVSLVHPGICVSNWSDAHVVQSASLFNLNLEEKELAVQDRQSTTQN